MKILLVQDRLRSGGTERQALLLTRSFREAGHDARLLLFRPGGALAPAARELPVRILQPFDTHLDWFAPGLGRAARAAAPDIVLCLGRMANCHGNILRAALPATPVVATFRTGKSIPLLYRRFLRAAPAVVANSHAAARAIAAAYRVPPGRLHVIPNGLVFPAASADSSADRETLRLRHGAGPDALVFLSVGTFRPEKNQRATLEIAARLPRDASRPWQLWFVGDGPERPACEALTRRLGLADRVRFHGFTADLAPFYAAADLAVLTSTRESLSNFLIEAQAAGLPAIAFAVRGADETMRPGESGWIIPAGDTAAFARHLAGLLTNPDERSKLPAASAAARAFARAAFAPERQTRAYLDLFQRLLAPPAP